MRKWGALAVVEASSSRIHLAGPRAARALPQSLLNRDVIDCSGPAANRGFKTQDGDS